MKYWKTDLRGAGNAPLDNIVPTTTANPAFWQHMVTFGISIGLKGTLDQSSVRDVLEQGLTEDRSEEHTSELQSLMRISYAVFCLKKKKYTEKHQTCPDTTK